jgi:hypothetical protein
MTKKERATTPAPEWWVIECFMNGMGWVSEEKDWRKRQGWLVDWMKPLLDDNRIRETGHLKYEVTDTGIIWWAANRAKELPVSVDTLKAPRFWQDGGSALDGKGVGGEVTYHHYADIAAAQAGIVAGYFDFVRYYMYPLSERWITVRLTRKGMDYFDSLPRLQLECA